MTAFSSMQYTIGTALERAREKGVYVEIMVDGHWVTGLVVATDAQGVVLDTTVATTASPGSSACPRSGCAPPRRCCAAWPTGASPRGTTSTGPCRCPDRRPPPF